MNRSFLVLSLLLSGAGVWLLRAQVNTSAIAGIVTDESGSVAPNVEVTAVQDATGLTRKTRTNETGEYVFATTSARTLPGDCRSGWISEDRHPRCDAGHRA